jgi:anti-sigma factor RsiW
VTDIHLDDDRLSAVVDGLAEPEDAAHAASCPVCQARLQQWQRVLDQLASVPEPTPDANRRDAAVAAALAENAAGIEGARKRRLLGRSPVAGVAAAVLVVAGLAFGLSQAGGGSPKNTSSAALRPNSSTVPSTAVGSQSPSPAASAPTAGPAGAATTTIPAPNASNALQNLGAFGTPSALVTTLRQAFPYAHSVSGAVAIPSKGCPAKSATDATGTPGPSPVFVAAVTYQGHPSMVSVFATKTGHVAVVETDNACVLLAKVPYS